MKKLFSFICAMMLTTMAWAGYGILVNECEYYAGTANPTPGDPSFQEYMCLGLHLNSGDALCLYDDSNGSKWVVDLDPASDKAFTKNGSSYSCSTTGVYDFYIKLKENADELYIDNGKPAPVKSDFQMILGDVAVNLTKNENPKDPTFQEWFVTGQPVDLGTVITFRDNTQDPAVDFSILNLEFLWCALLLFVNDFHIVDINL